MALTKDQEYEYYGNLFGGSSLHASDHSSPDLYGIDDHQQQKTAFEEGDSPEKTSGLGKNFAISSSSSLSSPSSSNSNGLGNQATKYPSDEGHSVISFKPGYANFSHASGSLLSFEQNERFSQGLYPKVSNQVDYSIWGENLHDGYLNLLNSTSNSCSSSLLGSSSCVQVESRFGSSSNGLPYGWLSTASNANSHCIDEPERQEACLSQSKRPYMEMSQGESLPASKKHCNTDSKKASSKSSPTKDPQSIAAKNRRERISERLKILQDLVPNGSKVDLVTMLEKAISYVKFLQLQVKVLATDEFWPVQGGKAPDLSQVREAIDAILASQRDRTSSSKC